LMSAERKEVEKSIENFFTLVEENTI